MRANVGTTRVQEHDASAESAADAGTYGAALNLTSADECTKVEPGYYSSLGAADPEQCPVDADGKPIDAFYCPGWEEDTEFRGSKPLLVQTGQLLVTETVEEVIALASFDPASFNETTTKAEFAAAVGAAAKDVVAEVVEAERRARLGGVAAASWLGRRPLGDVGRP